MGRDSRSPLIESCRRLSMQEIARSDGLRDGVEWDSRMTWPSGFTMTLQCRSTYGRPDLRKLRLQYEVEDYESGDVRSIDETFTLQRAPQPFGGYRWHILCPSSGRRCRVIYMPPGATRFRSRRGFRCRLQYRSQRLDPACRLKLRSERIAKRVLRKGPPDWQEEYADWEFPPRPPGMRWKTYNRLDEMAQDYQEQAEARFYLRVLGAAGSL